MVYGNTFYYSVEANTPKYLVVCDGGNVRSSALSTTLKLNFGRETIVAGRLFTSPETMKMLAGWADKILITQPHMEESIPLEFKDKILVCDTGPDSWGITIHPDLNEKVNKLAEFVISKE